MPDTTRWVRAKVRPTYDSRETGPRYHVTTRLGDRTIEFQKRIQDPFVRQTVHVGMRDLLRAVLHGRLSVVVIVGADRRMVDDVLDLDAELNTGAWSADGATEASR